MARQIFIGTAAQPGETINNYITRLKTSVEDCEYEGEERDNQIRDRLWVHIKDKPLQGKLYRIEEMTLAKLIVLNSSLSAHDDI